jgi:hypothetical protein
MKVDDLLQARISLLESGANLDNCLDGIPPEIASLIRLADVIRRVEWPLLDPLVADSQRSQLMSFIQTPVEADKDADIDKNLLSKKPFWKRWDGLTLALSASALLIFCIILTISIGGAWLFTQRNQSLVSEAPPTPQAPEEAVLMDYRGFVEVQDGDKWLQASSMRSPVRSGTQLRTGSLSSATIALYDGSQINLGPNSELRVEELSAKTENGSRIFIFTQLAGSSEHKVAAAHDENSRYEVRTAAATGTALGTVFKVQVNADQSVRFSVWEGEVSVTGNHDTVIVEAGEATVTTIDETPAEPSFLFSGTGEVSYIGESWVVAGQVLTIHETTVRMGDPLVGDLVLFEGRLLPDGSRLVDLIVLLRRTPANRFSVTGIVDTLSDTIWIVSGQEIAVTDITGIQDLILAGNLVLVEGVILPDGALQAEKILKLENLPGLPFEFSGIVEERADPSWKISGVGVRSDEGTLLDQDLAPGDLVHVSGWVLEDGAWLAKSILPLIADNRSFEFIGAVDSIDPWIVAGVGFETRDWTQVDEDITLHDLVRVSGQVMEDGAWVAYEIIRLDEPGDLRFILVGMVTSLHPWIVSNNTLDVDGETLIRGEIALGMLVRVEILILADGTWKILSIQPVAGFTWESGCREIVGRLITVNESGIILEGWPEIPLSLQAGVTGEMTPDSILLLQMCFSEDGSAVVVYVYVLFQPPVEEIEEAKTAELPNENVMICHLPNSRNPHTILVSRSALPAHLGHGDILGACP